VNRSAFSLKALQEPSVYVGVCIVLLSCILYLPFLRLPFLPDDYEQITLARKFAPIHQWRHLLEDPLYRNRATSLLLTYWTDLLFPLSAVACGISSILLHAGNGLLVYGLGVARSIGWRLSALTAIMFALQERPHEAIVWYAAIPELLVFMFGLTALLLWIRWLHADQRAITLWMAVLTCFVLALLSKESAVALILLMVLFAFLEKVPVRRALLGLMPIILVGAAYVIWVFQGQEQNHHFHDGTFVLQMGFLRTDMLSAARGLWVWGWVGVILILVLRVGKRRLLIAALIWTLASLLPYSFLTYMRTVPSRHHYLAAVGCSLIIAMAVLALWERTGRSRVVPWCFLLIALHHAAYLWTVKYQQFEKRSEPIEAFIQFLGRESRRPVVVQCSDYLFSEAQRAAHLRCGEPEQNLVFDVSTNHPDAASYCLPGL
jgi:hypothetical protein